MKQISTQVQRIESAGWRKAAKAKSSLALYRAEKSVIKKEEIYDNSWGSRLLVEARAGVLRT